MPVTSDEDRLDRHGLVMAIWMSTGFIAATLYHYGLGAGGAGSILSAFGAILLAFVGHVIVNIVSGSGFTTRELAVGLTATGAAVLAFGVAILLSRDFASRAFLPTSGGFIGLMVAFFSYLILERGLRPAFESFDAIRSFRARGAPPNGQGSARS